MKALVYTGEQTLEVLEVPDPVLQDGEVLVRVDAVGICGSDMHAWLGHDERRPASLILGHEVAGTISSGPRMGQRVIVNPLVTCGRCPACLSGRDNLCPRRHIISMPGREGGFAELIRSPENNFVPLPDHVSATVGCLTEPLACSWHAVKLGLRVLDTTADRVLVLGGGAIGFAAALAARSMGCTEVTIVEPNQLRRERLSEIDSFTVLEAAPYSFLPDMVIDAVGFAATRQVASEAVRPGGVIMHIGLGQATEGLNIRRMTLQEIAFIGTYTYTALDFQECAQAIIDGRLGACDWALCRPLQEGPSAFQDILNNRVAAPKMVLIP